MICIARTFGAPDTVPAGKHGHQRVEPIVILGQLPFDDRDQVHHVRVALERHEGRHAHAAVVADAAEIVAAEIDEHDVLGALLLVALQLVGRAADLPRPSVPRGRVPAIGCVTACRPSTRTSISGDEPTMRAAAHADEEHVRRRIDVAQRAIHGERIDADLGREPLREHDLVDVARGDVLLGLPHDALRTPAG